MHTILVPGVCQAYFEAAHGVETDASWGALLSFATCIQDGSTPRVERGGDVRAMLADLATRAQPSQELLVAAFEAGPPAIKLRAAYQLGMSQVALMIRARYAVLPEQRAQLERELEPYALRAYFLFRVIERAVERAPWLVTDEVIGNVVRSARKHVVLLRRPNIDDDELKRLERTQARTPDARQPDAPFAHAVRRQAAAAHE